MCGVIGLVYERHRNDLGAIAAELLKTLEYRGYDSTGAAIQGTDEQVRLLKGVGAPSAMVHKLGIVGLPGQIFCGQVRWATFGAVTDANAQPHVVRCKTYLYGAHNGNVTNCDALKAWLLDEGHAVLSDNDGEMVVHTVEHFFERELAALPPELQADRDTRRRCMRAAIGVAATRLKGSFAAVVVDPISRVLWAVKLGSSLYFGQGRDEVGGRFAIASSDLSSVLKLTRSLVPLAEGEFVEYEPGAIAVFAVDRKSASVTRLEREPVRSRLRAEDTALLPPFKTFMEQEIAAQEATVRNVVTLFMGGSEASRALRPYIDARPRDVAALVAKLEWLREHGGDDLAERFHALVDDPAARALLASVPVEVKQAGTDGSREKLAERLLSSDAGFFADLLGVARGEDDLLALRVLDVLVEREEQREFTVAVDRFAELCAHALGRGGRIFFLCCGTSFHAAKAAALFFNEIARTEIVPLLPGEFRGQYGRSLRDGDVVVAVSQSGETKDLIDVLNDVLASGKAIARVAVVNNVNSTLAQEKAQLVIPLRCGPEIAVPATKSFMNQVAIFYGLALKLAWRRVEDTALPHVERDEMRRELAERWERLPRLSSLIRATVESTAQQVEDAAELLFLRPSVHLLATRIVAVAKEGALKIREVVLNHAEGFEGSEFKHGPNTILGFNTVFGPQQVERLLARLGEQVETLLARASAGGVPGHALGALARAATEAALAPRPRGTRTAEASEALEAALPGEPLRRALYADYPLIYITGPDERDVALTISALHTHKIRGACSVVIAEENTALRAAAEKCPVDNPGYRSVYVALPRTDDALMAVFTSTVVLQRLALRMSERKMAYLDRLGFTDHGVHPDVPKNVSKSITVD